MKSVQVSVSLSLELLERVEDVAGRLGERRVDALRRVIAIGVDSVLGQPVPDVQRPDPISAARAERQRNRALTLEVAQERLAAMRVRYQMWREQTGQWADNGPGKLKNEEWTRRVRIAELAVLRAGGSLELASPIPTPATEGVPSARGDSSWDAVRAALASKTPAST